MTGTDLIVNKPHRTAAAQCALFTHKSVPVIFEPPCNKYFHVNVSYIETVRREFEIPQHVAITQNYIII